MRLMMNTSMKVILTAAGIAALASPVMAQTNLNTRVPASISQAHGSASHARTHRAASAETTEGSHLRIDDCVRTTFPQCGGN
jgi:hypothetical protein